MGRFGADLTFLRPFSTSRAAFTVATALSENTADPHESFDAVLASAAAAVRSPAAQHAAVAAAAKSWWEGFWGKSSVSLPTEQGIEALWTGAQYGLGVSASSDPEVPAPGLFGPFVTWDVNGWNGDYTLDVRIPTRASVVPTRPP